MAASSLVARADALGALHAALAGAREGRGGVVLLRGEPGIGKSALLAAFAASAGAAGVAVVAGRSWELGEAPPYYPLWPCLRALGVEPPASGADPFRLWEDVLAALAGRTTERALVWTLEDLHTADLQTLDLLTFLAQPIGTVRAL